VSQAGFWGGGGRLRRPGGRSKRLPTALFACALAICADGCQSTQEKSAQLEKSAKHERLALQGISVSRQSPDVQVLGTEVVHGHEGNAVIVRLRDSASKPALSAPIELTVRDAKGKIVYQNNAPGEDPSLTKVSLQPGAQSVWIDDQVHTEAVPASASTKVGEGAHPSGAAPKLTVKGLHLSGEGGEASGEGIVKNSSSSTQDNLVVFVLARKAGKVVAAGRAVLPEVLPGASDSFQIYFVGDPGGAKLEASAPPTTF
jgi:hypothetical protein